MKTENEKLEEEKKDETEPQNEAPPKEEKYINPDLLNDDLEESNYVEQMAMKIKPYFSCNVLPKSIYLQQTVLPLIYEALNRTEKKRPQDPIEFFCVYLLDNNKKNI